VSSHRAAQDVETDVLVVGGGLCGLAAAALLALQVQPYDNTRAPSRAVSS
jgi:phytoene dehydrogenase-like protein